MYGYIYLTTCLITNKIYIGQHCAKSFDQRYHGSGILIKKAIKKYGKINFKTILLEEIYTNQNDLNLREQYYINKYNSTDREIGYNLDNGGTGLGKHSLSTKQKISASEKGKIMSNESRQKIKETWQKKLAEDSTLKYTLAASFGTGMLGKKQSNKQKEAVRKARLGKKASEETKQKIKNNRQPAITASKKVWCRKVICIELNKIFDSIAEANQFFNRKPSASNIHNVINKTNTAYGYHWKYFIQEGI